MSVRSRKMLVAFRFAVLCVLVAPLAIIGAHPAASAAARQGSRLPERLISADFWKLTNEIAEPGGYFQIEDNFTSNEPEVGRVFSMLREAKISGGVYLGVGPEQNLSYIAAVRPKMAFIVDIRRQAMMQHLMFKALFEMSADRAEFISLLFSMPRPRGVDSASTIDRLWEAYWSAPRDSAAHSVTYTRILDRLTKTHGFELTTDEISQIKWVYDAFYYYGYRIATRGAQTGRGASSTNFADLTNSYDAQYQPQSFLSSEENFRYVKSLHERNLIVAVSGDFGGPKAIRAIGAYLKERGATVSAFYVSNVEQYLFNDGKQRTFYNNVAALPMNDTTVFIRPYGLRRGSTALCPMAAFLRAVEAGRIQSNAAAESCVR